jgi:hypothetical protein
MEHKERCNLYRVADGNDAFYDAFKQWKWKNYEASEVINNGYPNAMELRDIAFRAAYYSVSNCGTKDPEKSEVLAKYAKLIAMEKQHDEMIAESERLAREAGALRSSIYNAIDREDGNEPPEFKMTSLYMSH